MLFSLLSKHINKLWKCFWFTYFFFSSFRCHSHLIFSFLISQFISLDDYVLENVCLRIQSTNFGLSKCVPNYEPKRISCVGLYNMYEVCTWLCPRNIRQSYHFMGTLRSPYDNHQVSLQMRTCFLLLLLLLLSYSVTLHLISHHFSMCV